MATHPHTDPWKLIRLVILLAVLWACLRVWHEHLIWKTYYRSDELIDTLLPGLETLQAVGSDQLYHA